MIHAVVVSVKEDNDLALNILCSDRQKKLVKDIILGCIGLSAVSDVEEGEDLVLKEAAVEYSGEVLVHGRLNALDLTVVISGYEGEKTVSHHVNVDEAQRNVKGNRLGRHALVNVEPCHSVKNSRGNSDMIIGISCERSVRADTLLLGKTVSVLLVNIKETDQRLIGRQNGGLNVKARALPVKEDDLGECLDAGDLHIISCRDGGYEHMELISHPAVVDERIEECRNREVMLVANDLTVCLILGKIKVSIAGADLAIAAYTAKLEATVGIGGAHVAGKGQSLTHLIGQNAHDNVNKPQRLLGCKSILHGKTEANVPSAVAKACHHRKDKLLHKLGIILRDSRERGGKGHGKILLILKHGVGCRGGIGELKAINVCNEHIGGVGCRSVAVEHRRALFPTQNQRVGKVCASLTCEIGGQIFNCSLHDIAVRKLRLAIHRGNLSTAKLN